MKYELVVRSGKFTVDLYYLCREFEVKKCNLFFCKGFVRASAKFSPEFICLNTIISFSTRSLIWLYFTSMCFDCFVNLLVLQRLIVLWLSDHRSAGQYWILLKFRLLIIDCSQNNSQAASEMEMYSTSVVLLATNRCLRLLHDIGELI